MENNHFAILTNDLVEYCKPELDIDTVDTVEDCAKLLKFLFNRVLEPLPQGVTYGEFEHVGKYFK